MPTEQEIRKLAYKLWEEEGKPQGKDLEHHFRAIRILEEEEHRDAPTLVGAPPPMVEIATKPPPPLLKPSGGRLRPRKTK